MIALPKSIGQLTKLRKVMLSGNSLTSLPEEMKSCVNIELIRLAVNQLTSIPEWLLTLPKLAWIALSGNPCLRIDSVFQLPSKCRLIDWNKLEVQNVLGEGASGTVYKGLWTDEETKEVAVKIYKGAITSDGIAEDEIEVSLFFYIHTCINVLITIITADQRVHWRSSVICTTIRSSSRSS